MKVVIVLLSLMCFSSAPSFSNKAEVNYIDRTSRLLMKNTDDQTIQELMTRIQRLESLEARVEKLEKCAQVKPIGFTAIILAAPIQSLGVHQIIVFGHVVTNVGNALQPASSIFTAPVNGTYFFEVSIGPATTGTTDVELVKNGGQLRRISSHSDSGNPETATESVVTQLQVGDQIWVRQLKYNSGLAGWGHPSFTGFLVKAEC